MLCAYSLLKAHPGIFSQESTRNSQWRYLIENSLSIRLSIIEMRWFIATATNEKPSKPSNDCHDKGGYEPPPKRIPAFCTIHTEKDNKSYQSSANHSKQNIYERFS